MLLRANLLVAFLLIVFAVPGRAEDWPMWGRTPSRNMVGNGNNLPVQIDPGKLNEVTELIDLGSAENVRWVAKLGSQSYGNASVAFGKVFVGTNNESPRDKNIIGDRRVLMCFEESTGKFLWQLLAVPRPAKRVSREGEEHRSLLVTSDRE